MRRFFKGSRGRVWSFDSDDLLGPPGGFGQVCAGSGVDGTTVAIKIVPLREGSEFERRQRDRELEIATRLAGVTSDHLLIPIDFGYDDNDGNDLLIVMPRADRSLKDAIDSGLDRLAQYRAILDVALGLQELAEAGVLHRDLKPRNVLAHNRVWRIADFGISRDLSRSTAPHTFAGAGTLPYMAPELWQGRPATVKTDLYALGCLAFEVITGRYPFAGPEHGDFERQHRLELPPAIPDDVDAGLARLVLRLLAKDPSRRPQDARAVVEYLERIGEQLTAVWQRRLRRSVYDREQEQHREDIRLHRRDAAEETFARKKDQAIGDFMALFDEACPLLVQAVPDLQVERIEISDPEKAKSVAGFAIPEFFKGHTEAIWITQRFTFDIKIIEFHTWNSGRRDSRLPYVEIPLRDIGPPRVPIILRGAVTTRHTLDSIGRAQRRRTGQPSTWQEQLRHLPQRLANLACEERSGRLEWCIYRYTQSLGHMSAPWVEPLKSPAKVEPLTTETIAAILEEAVQLSD
jgi:serine/threonine protein kinase